MDLQLTYVDPLWHPERVWSWSKQISKLVAWEKKSRHFQTPQLASPFPASTPLRHDIPGTSPEIPDQTSALVLVENLLHPSLFFYDISTIRVARFCTRSIFAFKEYWFGDHTWVACLTWDFTRNRQSVRLTLTSVMRGQAHFRGPRSLLALATIVSCACLVCVASAWR